MWPKHDHAHSPYRPPETSLETFEICDRNTNNKVNGQKTKEILQFKIILHLKNYFITFQIFFMLCQLIVYNLIYYL